LAGIGQHPSEAKRLARLIYAALADAVGTTISVPELGANLTKEVAGTIVASTQEVKYALV
jgi:hypothetical protein